MQTVRQWLEQLGLLQYVKVFAANDVDLEALRLLSEGDLERLGVSLGNRKKLLNAIARLDAAASAAAPPQVFPQSTARGEAERRQLTVMFCDMVGSTELSRKLDPEQLRELMRAYQQACGSVTKKYDGHVAQYLGDGLMIYFGWPAAHEDDAERALRTGLDLIEAVKTVGFTPALQVRIGIATGPVVVGETGEGDASVPKLAVGETPNLAARLQSLARADEIVIGPSTKHLVGAAFDYRDLGSHTLKGILDPVHAWQVLGLGRTEGRFEAAHASGLSPLVGRDEEMALLLRRWTQSNAGEGQLVLLSGEPGIGKSRVTRALRESIQREPHLRLRYQCSPFHTQTALHPVIEQLERAAGFTKDDRIEDRLDKLEAVLRPALDQSDIATIAPLFAALLSLPVERYPPLNYSPERQKARTFQALVNHVKSLAKQQPVLMVFEDLHWVDPTTQEFLDLLVPAIAQLPVLLLATYRPEYRPRWTDEPHVSSLVLNRLNRRVGLELAAGVVAGKALPREVLEQIVEKTDGVPLFVEELTRHVVESGLLRDLGDRYALEAPLSALAIPSTLRDSLMARLDRLAPVKELAQLCAVLGREFSHELISAVSPLPEPALTGALDQLVGSQLIFRQGAAPEATYIFKHALVQDAAYESLLKSNRLRSHQRVATVLVEKFSEAVTARPGFVAHHFTEAGLPEQAIPYWRAAGDLALQRSANVEAISHFTKCLDLLSGIAASERDIRQELACWLGLTPAYIATRGFSTSEVENAARRARELCEKLGEAEGAAFAIVGKFAFHLVRAEMQQAHVEADAGLALSQSIGSPELVAQFNFLIGDTYYWEGQLAPAKRHLEKSISPWDVSKARYIAERSGVEAHCIGLAYLAHTEMTMGYADRARAVMSESLRDAEKLGHAQTMGHCLGVAAWMAVFARDIEAARQYASRTVEYCEEQQLMFWEASAYLVDGWVLIQEGTFEQGVKRMQEGFAIRRGAGAALVHANFYAALAECYERVGDFGSGLALIQEGFKHLEWSGERLAESELHRVQGELLFSKTSDANAAVQCFERALAVARQQQAGLYELRAAVSLARLWCQQRQRQAARDVLIPVHRWFTEGFASPDLVKAKALLAELET